MSRYSPSPPPKPQPPAAPIEVDRQTTTPFLLKLCYRPGAFHNIAEFVPPTPSNPQVQLPTHLQVYTWQSCTLRELAHLLTNALPDIVPDPAVGTRLSFRMIYPDSMPRRGDRLDPGRARYTSKELGSVIVSAPASNTNGSGAQNGSALALSGDGGDRTLAESRFVIGDFIDCAVFPPLSDGSVMPRGAAVARTNGGSGYGRGRGSGSGSGSYAPRAGAPIPSGEWRRGERLPGESGFRMSGPRPGRKAPY